MTMRPAIAEDLDFLYEVKKAAFREYIEQTYGPWDDAFQREIHERRFTEQPFRIVSFDGTDVGYVSHEIDEQSFYVHQLFLLPEHQCKGYGRRCMEAIIEEARALGLPVRLQVLFVNERALDFYRRLGFQIIGENENHNVLERC
jgi:GNAT superfamily N-acetyltransferase